MAAKFFTGLPLDGPDPECVAGHGGRALAAADAVAAPRPSGDHSRRSRPVPVSIGRRPPTDPGGAHPAAAPGISARRPPAHACDEHPLAGSGLAGWSGLRR
jgi:hypothetical protein